jgi:prepilin-type N-terminal cleavage/methylation domain-containing protein
MRDNKGFTLIELLIVVVIIGILAAIAIPKFGATREQAYISQMKSDLRNLQTAEELFYSTNGYVYTSTLADLDFATSEGVTVAIGSADAVSYTATASHTSAPGWSCGIGVGAANPVDGTASDGVVACTGP